MKYMVRIPVEVFNNEGEKGDWKCRRPAQSCIEVEVESDGVSTYAAAQVVGQAIKKMMTEGKPK